MEQRVFLHVGLPKTGTTVVQASLKANRKALWDMGVLVVGDEHRSFAAALDVRGNHKSWGLRRVDVADAWAGLCREARQHRGVSIISQELLAAASVRQIHGIDDAVVRSAEELALLSSLDLSWAQPVPR